MDPAKCGFGPLSREEGRGQNSRATDPGMDLPGAPVFEVFLNRARLVADGLDRCFELFLRYSEFFRPVAQFVVFVHVNARAVLATPIGFIVRHDNSSKLCWRSEHCRKTAR